MQQVLGTGAEDRSSPNDESDAGDICIYTATIDGEIRQISLTVAPVESFEPGVDILERNADGTKAPAEYGDESYLFLRGEDRGDMLTRLGPYTIQLSVRLSMAELALRDITEHVLAQL